MTRRTAITKQSVAMRRIVTGLLALAGVGVIVIWSLLAIADRHALTASPACSPQLTGTRCHGELRETVDNIYIDTSHDGTEVSIYLYGSAPEVGWVNFDSGDAAFARALRAGDVVTAEIWHGKAVAVTAHGETVGTQDRPDVAQHASAAGIAMIGFLAFVLLRSASRTRLWNRLGFEPTNDGPERRLMWIYGFTAGMIGAAGTGLLAAGIAWAAALVALSAGAVLYGLFVPWLLPRFRDLFIGYGPENAEGLTPPLR